MKVKRVILGGNSGQGVAIGGNFTFVNRAHTENILNDCLTWGIPT